MNVITMDVIMKFPYDISDLKLLFPRDIFIVTGQIKLNYLKI